MVKYLAPFLNGNERIPLASGDDADHFRGIVTTGQFSRWEPIPVYPPVPYIMNFADYVLLKARYEMNVPPDYPDLDVKADMAAFIAGYWAFYPLDAAPMPAQQPSNFNEYGLKTFGQYLNDKGLFGLVGPLQYGYSVQGYGPLDGISAFYGLIWIPPSVTNGMAEGDLFGTPVVTAFSKGWGDMWEQMKAGMKITYNVTTLKITRPS